MNGVRLYVGGDAGSIQGEKQTVSGYRCYSAVNPINRNPLDGVEAMLDSGAFSDPPEKRLTFEAALDRQMRWEARAQRLNDAPDWYVSWLVSYDLLIDETWVHGERHKRRWSVTRADEAVSVTVGAARYLASQRSLIAPRVLVLAAQGVDAIQYTECAVEVLKVAEPSDWFGFGGWCILGRFTRMMPEFWRTIRSVVPLVASAGVGHVHIFGVLYAPALGGLLWMADQFDLTVSTDSSAPMVSCTRGNSKKAGVRRPYWRDNVAWWIDFLGGLRDTKYYCEPPDLPLTRQLEMDLCTA